MNSLISIKNRFEKEVSQELKVFTYASNIFWVISSLILIFNFSNPIAFIIFWSGRLFDAYLQHFKYDKSSMLALEYINGNMFISGDEKESTKKYITEQKELAIYLILTYTFILLSEVFYCFLI